MLKLKHRYVLGSLANALHLESAIEIGTHQAVFASEFMQRFCGKIFLVDPYIGYEHGVRNQYWPCFDESSVTRRRDFEIAMIAMKSVCSLDQFEFLIETSEQASRRFADRTVGLVYIDGLHDYESVRRDIELWMPKVHSGGILSGHDYCNDHPGVMKAVQEMIGEVGVIEDEMPSWWIQVP